MDAIDTAYVLGDFIGAKFYVVNTLNRELDKRKEEIIILKEELEQVIKQHEDQITNLVKISDARYNELQVKNVSLQDELHKEKTTNTTLAQKVVLLEK